MGKKMDSGKGQINYESIIVSRQLVRDYTELLQSHRVIGAAMNKLKIKNMSEETFGKKVSINLKNNTSVLEIKALDSNAVKTKNITNCVTKIFIKKIKQITNQNNIIIVDLARVPHKPVKPNRILNILIAFLISLGGSMGAVALWAYIDNIMNMNTIDDVQNLLGYNVIGIIPSVNIR
jgi:capsular polysaccharide biosynthesis protein